jgi:BlaI family penicillinase repressor
LSRKQKKLSPANLEIMKIIWDRREVTISDVVEAINAGRKDSVRRTTIQVQMGRLEEYGWLKHRQEGRTFFYSAVVPQRKTTKDILDDVKNRVFGGSRAELVRCLLEDEALTSEEIDEMRALLQLQKEG